MAAHSPPLPPPKARRHTWRGGVCLSFLPCHMIPFLSRTCSPVFSPRPREIQPFLLPGTLGRTVPSSNAFCVYKGLSVFYCFTVACDEAIRPSTAVFSPSPMIMGEWNCGCGSLCSSRRLGCLLFILGRLCSSPSLPRHDLTLSQIIPGGQNGVYDQCCLHFTDGTIEELKDLNKE